MQWSAVKNSGVNDVIESLSSVPVHAYEFPFSCMNTILPVALLWSTNGCDCGDTHLTLTLQLPESPMSLATSAPGRNASPASARCETWTSVSFTPLTATPGPAESSIVARDPSSTGDHQVPNFAVASAI